MSDGGYLPDAGDLVWTDFDRTLIREQTGRRPALIVSPAASAIERPDQNRSGHCRRP